MGSGICLLSDIFLGQRHDWRMGYHSDRAAFFGAQRHAYLHGGFHWRPRNYDLCSVRPHRRTSDAADARSVCGDTRQFASGYWSLNIKLHDQQRGRTVSNVWRCPRPWRLPVLHSSNVMPMQYFSRRLGLANALVKFSGGLGATILSLVLNSLINKLGAAWMFRILGIMTLATSILAALAIEERTPLPNVPILDIRLFKNVPFTTVFLAGATLIFTLFIAPFFLPLSAQSIGLSSNVGAGLVAALNACTAVGRFVAGPLCDRIGPLNTFAITVVLNALTMLAMWPVSSTLPLLVIFATLNGTSNGAFFTTLPTVVASMVDPSRAATSMSLSITGWTAGYLMGTPVTGYLLEASGVAKSGDGGIDAYRAAIFYAGGIATVGLVFVLVARLHMDRKLLKRV